MAYRDDPSAPPGGGAPAIELPQYRDDPVAGSLDERERDVPPPPPPPFLRGDCAALLVVVAALASLFGGYRGPEKVGVGSEPPIAAPGGEGSRFGEDDYGFDPFGGDFDWGEDEDDGYGVRGEDEDNVIETEHAEEPESTEDENEEEIAEEAAQFVEEPKEAKKEKESTLLKILSPIVFVPSHSHPGYRWYQNETSPVLDANLFKLTPEQLLHDTRNPHGTAFDFMLNRDERPLSSDERQVIQRFVLALLFYATGGVRPRWYLGPSMWDESEAPDFLAGSHECHWVKERDEILSWEFIYQSEDDKMVGVTKCNNLMEVTKIDLSDLDLIGFIPEEIKWLGSLEYFDMSNNELAGPIPTTLGELHELRYLSLDENHFSGAIPDVFAKLLHLERVYLDFNNFHGDIPPSLCTLREEGVLMDLWSDCVDCTADMSTCRCACCTVCCGLLADCNEMDSEGHVLSEGAWPDDDPPDEGAGQKEAGEKLVDEVPAGEKQTATAEWTGDDDEPNAKTDAGKYSADSADQES